MSWKRPNIGSRVNREVHARFWERPGVRFLRATRHSRRIDTAPPVAACPLRLHRALALRSLCDGHHKKALFIAELREKNRAFLAAPALAPISRHLMHSHEATD